MSPERSAQPASPRSSGESPKPRIQRKPLPNTAVVSGKDGQGTPDHHRLPPVPRSPLAEMAGLNAPPLPDVPRPLFHDAPQRPGDQPPPLPARPRNGHSPTNLGDPFNPAPDPFAGAHTSHSPKRRLFAPFALTLIRRDPSSGQQWNVGKIASFQLENPELIEDEKRHHQGSPSIQIHLEASGYAKFRGMPSGPEVGLRGSLDIRPGSASSMARQFTNAMPGSHTASGAFERQVKMVYSPSFTANLRKHFRGRSSVDENHSLNQHPSHRPISPIKRPGLGHGREDSHTSLGSFGGDFDGSEAPIITQPAPGLKPRGYMFYSPWNGRCEFLTGKAGRSLRCRHVLPSYGGGVYNPLVEGHDPEHGDDKADNNTRPISELRFNLPSNELLADKKSTEGGARARDQIHSQFNKMVAKAQGLDDNSDDGEFHFDMSLGREKAGGGNRGKRAKMGKLIVFDEGLKMLDLAVAANVGIWWTTWERTY